MDERGRLPGGQEWLPKGASRPLRLDTPLLAFLIALVALACSVAMASALLAMRFAIHGERGDGTSIGWVHSGRGRTGCGRARLSSPLNGSITASTCRKAKSLSQIPSAGMKVRRGWQVRVAQSLGPQRVAIPDIVGESAPGGRSEYSPPRTGCWTLGVFANAGSGRGSGPCAKVRHQMPAAFNRSAKLSLLVTRHRKPATFVMPSFVGQPLGTVNLACWMLGFALAT